MASTKINNYTVAPQMGSWKHIKRELSKSFYCYLIFLPVLLYYIIFHYIPMYGIIISFKDYSPYKGIWGSAWVGLKHFTNFFNSYYCLDIIRNTILLSLMTLAFGFPIPIIMALMINEVKNKFFKRMVQTVSYLPHFISLVIIIGMLIDFTSGNGVVNNILFAISGKRIDFLGDSGWFRPLYVISHIWKEFGWSSIIYIAALSGIDVEQYEAAMVDGAGRWRRMWYITIPGIMPTIVITLILACGSIMNIGFEKVFLMQNTINTDVSEVISTFVYKSGILQGEISYATAIGLFNNIINFCILISINKISKHINETSLW